MTMDADTEKALRESIAHWERLATGTALSGEWISGEDCALCRKFRLAQGACGGCPVAEATELADCDGSPYFDAAYLAKSHGGIKGHEFYAAARVELDFLRSLLPEPT